MAAAQRAAAAADGPEPGPGPDPGPGPNIRKFVATKMKKCRVLENMGHREYNK